MTSRRMALLGLALIMLSSLSGCIHVELGKDILGVRKLEIKYVENEKAVIKHFFDTAIFDPNTYTYYGHNTTDIPARTQWMKVTIIITLEPLPQDLPIPLPEDIRRFVRLTVTRSDGTEWLTVEYTETAEETVTINTPLPGTWGFTIDAAGYGSNTVSYHDGFKIIINALEPE